MIDYTLVIVVGLAGAIVVGIMIIDAFRGKS